MHLIITSDTKGFPLTVFRSVYAALNHDLSDKIVTDVTFYYDGNWSQPFVLGIRKAFRQAQFHHRKQAVNVAAGHEREWSDLIRKHAYSMDDRDYILFLAHEGLTGITHCAVVHSGLLTNLTLAREVQPGVTDDIRFYAVDTFKDFYGVKS